MRNGRYLLSVGLITAVILAVAGLLWNTGGGEPSLGSADLRVTPWYLGVENTPVTIDLYTDYLCAVCLEKERMARQAFEYFAGRIRLVCHHYPMTDLSRIIAALLEAAGKQGMFWELHDRLIHDEPRDIAEAVSAARAVGMGAGEFSISYLLDEAEAVGLDSELLIRALGDEHYAEMIRLAIEDAESCGVTTASLYLNGKEYQAVHGTLEELYGLIEEELKRTGGDDGE